MRGDIVMPSSVGNVIAAGKEDATPRPMPIAEDQRSVSDGTAMHAAETMQHNVFMKSDGHADVTKPDRHAQARRPSDMADQKLDVMIAIVSCPRPRCLIPYVGSHVAVACSHVPTHERRGILCRRIHRKLRGRAWPGGHLADPAQGSSCTRRSVCSCSVRVPLWLFARLPPCADCRAGIFSGAAAVVRYRC